MKDENEIEVSNTKSDNIKKPKKNTKKTTSNKGR